MIKIMSPTNATVVAAILGALFLLLVRLAVGRKPAGHRRAPPGPCAFPIIGNLHMMGSLPHQNLYRLAKKYGPIMSMRLGHVPAVVISSPAAAELFLKTHDAVFASRPKALVAEYFLYGAKGVILTQYGSYWRNIRRICIVKLLNTVKVDSFFPIRRAEAAAFVHSIRDAAAAREVVDVSKRVANVIENTVCLMVIGRSRDPKFKLKEIIQEAAQLAGAFNVGEYIPYLMPFDLQGLTRRIRSASKAFNDVLEVIIDDHIQDPSGGRDEKGGDFVDVLLSQMNKPMDSNDTIVSTIERTNVKAILVDMIGAAMDTSTSAVEWAISELMRKPQVMRKLQEELKSVVGMDRLVDETDLPKLPFLELVVKETLRLHPPGPLLVPRESMEDITVDGYFIPKKSRIIINAWAIGRDTGAWPENPEEFLPERFMGSKVDVLGQDFQLIPFGSGRRGCPGMRLGLTMVRLVVAQFVHCFDWELAGGTSPEDLDMSEKFGITMAKAHHLLALPTYRLET